MCVRAPSERASKKANWQPKRASNKNQFTCKSKEETANNGIDDDFSTNRRNIKALNTMNEIYSQCELFVLGERAFAEIAIVARVATVNSQRSLIEIIFTIEGNSIFAKD